MIAFVISVVFVIMVSTITIYHRWQIYELLSFPWLL